MKTFKQYLKEQEVKTSKRVGIEHIYALKPLEFIDLCRYFKNDLKGIIKPKKVKINLKMDGAGLRIGLDANKKFFIESSRSGPVFKPGAFAEYTINKFGKSNEISDSYDKVLSSLLELEPLQRYLRSKFHQGVKLFCELLFTPNAKQIEGKLQFLVVKYDADKLGKLFSLIFYKAEDLDGNQITNEQQIFNDLKKLSTNRILLDDQTIDYEDIDIEFEVNDFLQIIDDQADVEYILTSRKKDDQPAKEALVNIISKYQKMISDKIIQTKFNNKFGSEFEGLVLYFTNGKVVKVVTDVYKSGKQDFNVELANKRKANENL